MSSEVSPLAGQSLSGVTSPPPNAKIARFVARVTVRAIEPHATIGPALEKQKAVLLRIRKILERASHPSCSEEEMKAANRLASKYMQTYNVTQAQVYQAAAEHAIDPSEVQGYSVIEITSTQNNGTVVNSLWAENLADAMAELYDCKCFSTRYTDRLKFKWTFYGIAVSTVAAAETYEAIHNIVLDWAGRIKRGVKNSYCLGFVHGIQEVVDEEKAAEMMRAEQAEGVQRPEAHAATSAEPGSDLSNPGDVCADGGASCTETPQVPTSPWNRGDSGQARRRPSVISIYSDDSFTGSFDSEMECEDLDADFKEEGEELDVDFKDEDDDDVKLLPMDLDQSVEDELKHYIRPDRVKPEPRDWEDEDASHSASSGNDEILDVQNRGLDRSPSNDSATAQIKMDPDVEIDTGAGWQSTSALVVYRKNALKIAEDYLQDTLKIKLKTRRARDYTIRDEPMFEHGKRDSKKVDVKRHKLAAEP